MAQSSSRYEAVPSLSSIERLRDDEILLEDLPPLSSVKSRERKIISRRPQFKWSSGLRIISTMIIGFIILFAVIAYLSFIWFGKGTGSYWSRIALSNWVSTSVVMSAVIIRTVVTYHMMLNTSVLALIAMRTGVALNKIPRISSMRYSNSGPLELLYLFFRSAKYCLSPCVFSLTLISGVLTILLQFSSTLLISDLATDDVKTPANSSRTAVMPLIHPEILSENFYTDGLISSETTYPVFAEFSQREERSNDSRVDDTGPMIRALLPVSTETHRSRILSFEGNASIYDARWICSQPKVTNISLVWTGTEGLYLTGNVEPLTLVAPMVTANHSTSFNCSLIPTTSFSGIWTLMTCPLIDALRSGANTNFGLMSGIDTAYNTTKVHTILNQTWTKEYTQRTRLPFDPDISMDSGYFNYEGSIGYSDLLINVTNIILPYEESGYSVIRINETVITDDWYLAANDSSAWNSTGIGPWTRLESTQAVSVEYTGRYKLDNITFPIKNLNMVIDMSYCSDAYAYVKNVQVKAQRKTSKDEPISLSDGILQIGATGNQTDTEERGIMQLDEAELYGQLEAERTEIMRSKSDVPINPVSSDLNQFVTHANLQRSPRAWFPLSLYMGDSLKPVHESRVGLFQHIIQDTGSPALAMQAMQHTLITDRYYKYMPLFKNESTQIMTFTEQAIQPVKSTGFIVVLIGLLLHMALTAFTFITLGGSSGWAKTINSIDQSWQSYAQVLTLRAEVDEILDKEDSTQAIDDKVEKKLKQQGLANQIFVLAENDDGQVRFRKGLEGLKEA
ncbi:hypothetical protein EPUS_05120 [Endocarpon pusillum Z07020]|uniref:Uncharacterized protein n=1 Tax=Endocarpon pusillum (strain Z07020 / HMAS-L-300199) TaxID=1263415 RepID=U1GF97_ENDPU|nr:uncharacterized protein EPUS_05120 [Endocarpon pusillum Z07020]ERF70768.1 hypothetical protein EPUS_05120 [Endocarpon pusillum Z07020]